MVKSICRPRMSGKKNRMNWTSFSGSRRTARTSFSSLVPKALIVEGCAARAMACLLSRPAGRARFNVIK